MVVPISGVSLAFDSLFSLMAFLFISQRIRSSQTPVTESVRYLRTFFAYFTGFFILMGLPHLLLFNNDMAFAEAMAWGYTVGHVLLFISLTYLAGMTLAIIPAWSKYDKAIVIIGSVLNIVITLLETIYMIFGTYRPYFDYQNQVTVFNAPVIVGVLITLYVLFAFLPPAVLFTVSAIKSRGPKRRRAALLAAGMSLIILAGPLHDTARSWQTFLVADIFTGLATCLLAAGIVYKLDQSLAYNKPVRAAARKA